MRRLALLSLALVLTGAASCGQGDDGTGSGSETGATTGESGETVAGTLASTTATSSTGTGGVEGLTVDSARHSYQCIDGCESFYSDDFLDIELTADVEMDIAVTWHDWTITDRDLVLTQTPFGTQNVHLDPGVKTAVEFHYPRDGFCSMDEWNEPMRALITIDDVPLEITGMSTGAGGFDC